MLGLVLPSESAAERTWHQSFSLPATAGAYGPQPYVDGSGATTVNWTLFGKHSDFASSLVTSTRPGAGTFAPPKTFSFPYPRGDLCNCNMVFNGRGDALATWLPDAAVPRVRAAFRPAGGAVGRTRNVSRKYDIAPEDTLNDVIPTINERGDAAVLWFFVRGDAGYGTRVAFKPAGGSFGHPQLAMRPTEYDDLQNITMNERGDVLIAWIRRYRNGNRLLVRERPPGGRFGKAQVSPLALSRYSDPYINIEMNAHGDALIVASEPGARSVKIQAVVRAANGSFGSPDSLDNFVIPKQSIPKGIEPNPANPEGELETLFGYPSAKLNESGEAMVSWLRPDSTTQERIVASIRPPGGRFGPAQTLTTGGRVQISFTGASVSQLQPGDLALNANGDGVATWRRLDSAKSGHVEASTRSVGGPFGPVALLAPSGQNTGSASVFVEPTGDALATWPRLDAKGNSVSIEGAAHSP